MAPIYRGSDKIDPLYIGGQKISEAYVGSTKVYASVPAYNPLTVDGDGINDYYYIASPGPTGIANGDEGTIVFALDLNADNTVGRFLHATNNRVWAGLVGDGSSRVQVANTAGAILMQIIGTIDTTGIGPVQVAASWIVASGQEACHLYVNGVADPASPTTLTAGEIQYTPRAYAFMSDVGGSNLTWGRVAYWWFDTVYHDLSQASILQDVWDNGEIQDPGSDGSNYFSTQPLVYHARLDGDAVSQMALDRGTSGDTWVENGAFGDGGRLYS